MPTTGDLSLYFHIPFCKRKCFYCHFYSKIYSQNLSEKFISFLLKELESKKESFCSHPIVSIYFGGGTPTCLSIDQLSQILSWLYKICKNIQKNCEITIEANPEGIFNNFEYLKNLSSLGINRVSIGVQSFDDFILKHLNRIHTAKQAIEAINLTNKAGINNISIDLMYDVPYQNEKNWDKSLNVLDTLSISHLSLYNLTIEPNTVFERRKNLILPHIPKEKLSLKLLQQAEKALEEKGFKRYEISAFAKCNKISHHNSGYWTGRSFLGFGPSAFSYFNNKRFQNTCSLQKYMEAVDKDLSPIDFEEELLYPDNVNELFTIGLRMIEGIDIKAFEKKYNFIPSNTKKELSKLVADGFIEKNGFNYRLSKKGLLFYDHVATCLI